MKWTHSIRIFSLLLLLISPLWAMKAKSSPTHAPVPVQVSVSVSNANWVQTISICNTSSQTIPLTNLEFTFNYAKSMPSNIWGQPWAAWRVSSQTGSAVTLAGGTPWTPPLPPDPNCVNPLTIQFNASPDSPTPTGPFVFKAEGGAPAASGNLNITLPQAPAAGLSNPTMTVTGSDTNQQKVMTWGSTWTLQNLTPGTYTIKGTAVDNGSSFFTAQTATANVSDQQTTNQTITYQPVPSASVTVNLVQAPSEEITVRFSGSQYALNKSVTNGASIALPADTYTLSASIPGYSISITPNPITVPGASAVTITFSEVQPTTGGYTTANGLIVDKNNNPVTFHGVNWFGFNTGNHMLHGLWQADFTRMMQQMKTIGFNAVRIPFQFDFILDESIKPSSITTTCGGTPCNRDIPQDSALKAFQWVVKQFTDNGFYVLLDDHYEDRTYVNNFTQWVSGWQKIAQLFADNPQVGYDIYNEPDAQSIKWETGANPWSQGLTAATEAIYAIDKTKLIFIEGVAQGDLEANWGDGFATDDAAIAQGVSNPKAYFTQLMTKPYLNQIVVSPHAYGPNGTNNQGPDHSDQTIAWAAWSRLHGYLLNNFQNVNGTSRSGFCLNGNCHIFPIAVGEFGGKFDPADPFYTQDRATLINLANFITRLGEGKPAQQSWFYWSWNPNSGNTGGILKDDWATVDCNKVNYLKQYLFLKPAANICS